MASEPARPSSKALSTLFASSAGLAGLAVYQWFELLEVRNGKTPACAINETVNCATVWNSAFASRVHDVLGMPVAALGIIYGVVGLALVVMAHLRTQKSADASAFLSGLKIWALVGLASCVMFAAASFQAHAVCLTCLGTYALTAVFAFAAFKMLPGPAWPESVALAPGAAWGLVFSVPVYLVLMVPGGKTPHAPAEALAVGAPAGTLATTEEVAKIITALPDQEKKALSYARASYLAAPALDNSAYPVRIRRGSANATLRIVDFTDIRCPHCRIFEDVLREVERVTPPGTVSIEPRQFPLDGDCNPQLKPSNGDGVRCLAAQVQICLESNPAYFDVRHVLFDNQQSLTRDFVLNTAASKSGLSTDALLACATSMETTAKLRQDVEYAMRYNIEGTPMVLVNDKLAMAAPVFILGLAVARGDLNASYFSDLPPPPSP